LIDDDLGPGEVAADVNRPVPLQLTALDDMDVRVVSIDGHRCRAGDLGLRLWTTGAEARHSKRRSGYDHDSVTHLATSILVTKLLGLLR
jgi:hypothetical protein